MPFWRRKQKPRLPAMSLREAVDSGRVSFELQGMRPGDASSVRLVITSLTDEPIEIEIPRGTEFLPVPRPRQGG